nr:hypothetical protein CFP56_01289 [Quercus suber]
MAGLSALFPLIVLFVILGVAAFIGYALYEWSNELADKASKQLESKNMSFTKDGGLRVGVKELKDENYADKTQKCVLLMLRRTSAVCANRISAGTNRRRRLYLSRANQLVREQQYHHHHRRHPRQQQQEPEFHEQISLHKSNMRQGKGEVDRRFREDGRTVTKQSWAWSTSHHCTIVGRVGLPWCSERRNRLIWAGHHDSSSRFEFDG